MATPSAGDPVGLLGLAAPGQDDARGGSPEDLGHRVVLRAEPSGHVRGAGRVLVLAGEREDPRLESDHRRTQARLASSLAALPPRPERAGSRPGSRRARSAGLRGGTRMRRCPRSSTMFVASRWAASAPGPSPAIAWRSAMLSSIDARVSRRLVDPSKPSMTRCSPWRRSNPTRARPTTTRRSLRDVDRAR